MLYTKYGVEHLIKHFYKISRCFNNLQLLYSEVRRIQLYQVTRRPILPLQRPKRRLVARDVFFWQIWSSRGNRGLVKFVIFPKSSCAQLYSSFEMKMRKFLQETESPKGRLSNL